GSFIPFRFSDDPEFVRSQFVRFFAPPYDHGVRRFSLPDVVSNVLLFVPFGLLCVGGEFSFALSKSLSKSRIHCRTFRTFVWSVDRTRSNVFSRPNCIDPGRSM